MWFKEHGRLHSGAIITRPPIKPGRAQFWCETQGSGFGGIRAQQKKVREAVWGSRDIPNERGWLGGKELRPKLAEPRELRITVCTLPSYVQWQVRYGEGKQLTP